MLTVLLEGIAGCGKTALAAHIAMFSKFPHVKIINYDKMFGSNRVQYLHKEFNDSYKSPQSIIILDDIERIIEYVRIGPQFANATLQELMNLIKKRPDHGNKLLVLATATDKAVIEELGLLSCFNASINIPLVQPGTEIETVLNNYNYPDVKVVAKNILCPIAIKKLIMVSEMAYQGNSDVPIINRFVECLDSYGIDL